MFHAGTGHGRHVVTVGALVQTLNEENNIGDCLSSVVGQVDEIVVVDMHSDDRTVEIAREFGARVYFHERLDCTEPSRNFALSKVGSDWALILDADEEAGPDLVKGVREIISGDGQVAAVFIPRKNMLFGGWLRHCLWPDWQPRAVRKGTASWSGMPHEHPEIRGHAVYLPAEERYAIWHKKEPDLEANLVNAAKFSRAEARRRVARGEKPIAIVPLICKTLDIFTGRFFMAHGYKDGMRGFLWSALEASYHFMVQCHIWDLSGRPGRVAETQGLWSRPLLLWAVLRTKIGRRLGELGKGLRKRAP